MDSWEASRLRDEDVTDQREHLNTEGCFASLTMQINPFVLLWLWPSMQESGPNLKPAASDLACCSLLFLGVEIWFKWSKCFKVRQLFSLKIATYPALGQVSLCVVVVLVWFGFGGLFPSILWVFTMSWWVCINILNLLSITSGGWACTYHILGKVTSTHEAKQRKWGFQDFTDFTPNSILKIRNSEFLPTTFLTGRGKMWEHMPYDLHLHVNIFMLESIFKTQKPAPYC